MTASEFQRYVVDLSRRRTAAEADHRAALRRLLCVQRAASGPGASEGLVRRRNAAHAALDVAVAALAALEAEAAAATKIPVTEDPQMPVRRSSTVIGLTY